MRRNDREWTLYDWLLFYLLVFTFLSSQPRCQETLDHKYNGGHGHGIAYAAWRDAR